MPETKKRSQSCSRLKAVVLMKCPRCCEGELFLSRNPYNFNKMGKMPDECANCGQDFVIEPGFYFGAAMVSYILQVFMIAIGGGVVYLLGGDHPLHYVGGISAFILLTAPYVMVFSRGLWLSFFIRKPD